MTVVKAGRRHILLGHFPVPLSTLSTRVTHDAVIPPLQPELGPTSGPAQTPGPVGQCLLSPEKTVTLGLEHPGSGDWKSPKRRLQPRSPSGAQNLDRNRGGLPRWSCIFSWGNGEIRGSEGLVPDGMPET